MNQKLKILLLLFLLLPMTALAQFSLGVRGGYNLTKVSLGTNDFKTNRYGFFVGPVAKITFPVVGLGVEAAALYDQRSAKVAETSDGAAATGDESIKQKSFNIPVNLRYNIGLGSLAGIYLAVGPQFGFPVGEKWYKTKVGDYRLRDANLSFNFGAGVTVIKHLEVGFTYNLAAGKSGEFKNVKNGGDIDTHNNAWQIGAAIYF
jgi:hypothetical protein